jgi:hypothetical protein
MFHVEGYVNTPELSAGRGGGLSQGLPANGPYKSLFRARSESRCGSGKTATTTAAAAAGTAPDAGLHVLAEAAQSPEAQSPVSAASPAPARTPVSVSAPSPAPAPAPAPPSAMTTTPRKRRKPSPLVPSSPAPSVTSLGSVVSVAQPQPLLNNASSSLVADPSLLQPPPPRGRVGKSKHREHREKAAPASATAPPRPPAWAIGGDHEQRYERRSLSGPIAEPHHETGSVVRARSRSMQKNRAASQEMPSVSSPTAPANGGGYDHSRDYYPSGYDAELPDVSNITVHATDEGVRVQSPSTPPKKWESPRPSPPVINHYPASTYATSKEPSPAHAIESRPLTPPTKSRMLTLLIEDRRNGSDELAEVHVPLKIAGEGYLWADAKDVCVALQSGPSRIDGEAFRVARLRKSRINYYLGPARVLTMRGKYRQTFLRVSADGEETTQSANLKVETNRTLSIIVEDVRTP